MSTKENEIQDRVILVDGEPPSNPQAGVWFAFVNKLLKTKDSAGNIATYPKIEQGSNTDGDWYKLYLTEYTGLMICFMTGNASLNTNAFQTYNYPLSFSSTPVATVSFARSATNGTDGNWWAGVDNISVHTADLSILRLLYRDSQTATDGTVYMMAIGTFDDTP